jgi:hypothetical protein
MQSVFVSVEKTAQRSRALLAVCLEPQQGELRKRDAVRQFVQGELVAHVQSSGDVSRRAEQTLKRFQSLKLARGFNVNLDLLCCPLHTLKDYA